MGADNNRPIITEAGAEAGTGGSTENKSTTPAETGRSPRRIRKPAGAGTAGADTEAVKKTDVKADAKQNLLTDKKEEVAPVPETEQKQKKPKRVRTTKKKTTKLDTGNIDKMLVGISEVVASRPNCGHWKLSEKEAKTITEPLTAILSEKEVFQKIEEHSNEIALVTACVAVFVPRIFVTVQLNNAKKQELKKADEQRKVKQTESNNIKSNGGSHGQRPASNKNDEWNVAELIPSVG